MLILEIFPADVLMKTVLMQDITNIRFTTTVLLLPARLKLLREIMKVLS